jgi:hypothetical protein
LTKVKSNPLLIVFEWGVSKTKPGRRFGERFGPEIDVVVRGDAVIGDASTIIMS